MTKDEIIKTLRDMAKYPTVTLPRDCEALRMAADLLAQPQQEPVAWMHPDGRIWTFGRGFDKSTFTIPLYTTPPQRKPLKPDLEADTGYGPNECAAFTAGWEAAEAAHGIKE